MDDIFVYYVGLPTGVREIVMPCSDGFTIYINECLDEEGRMKAYEHALRHIRDNDWSKKDVQEIEYHAHRKE